MSTAILVPALGESISEAILSRWIKAPGDAVGMDDPIVELETDKITVEVRATSAGVLASQSAKSGDRVNVGDSIGEIDTSAKPAQAAASQAPVQSAAAPAPAKTAASAPAMPSARAQASRSGVDLAQVQGSGRGGRILKEDVIAAAASRNDQPAASPPAPKAAPSPAEIGEREKVVPMSPLRQTIANRLVSAQNTAAILTTFNEVDMSAIMELRNQYKDTFVAKYGIKLGFMSFFVKAAVEALKAYPEVNAEIRGTDVVYKSYYDIGVAVGGGKGLVVPVVRNADQLSLAEIELEIARLAGLAKSNKLALSDLTGGTFTISNGGVYGSMLSTPILNSPQTGILGLHNIVERPVAIAGKVEIRPVMYLALSYDHRLIDGREGVSFLVRIKQCIEDPRRLLLSV
jgi:2-oxoglutarate dehydrogenase E2 component (dihydrolipoamide succinyltransferase)